MLDVALDPPGHETGGVFTYPDVAIDQPKHIGGNTLHAQSIRGEQDGNGVIAPANGFDQEGNEQASIVTLLRKIPVDNNASHAGV